MTRSEMVADNNVAYYHAYKYTSVPDLQRKYHYQYALTANYERGTRKVTVS